MVVRRDFFAIHGELGLAIADRSALSVLHVAEHLVIGAVFLDDVEHVLDRARVADLGRDGAVARNRGGVELGGMIWGIEADLAGISRHLLRIGFGDEGDRALEGLTRMIKGHAIVQLVGLSVLGREIRTRRQPLAISDQQELVIG